jgi:hypothetical protein
MSTQRTITLTARPPVRIEEGEWPVIARGSGDSYAGGDFGKHRQALAQGEVDTYSLRVRMHADGRHLVYGVLVSANAAWRAPAGGECRRGGELLDKEEDVVSAILRVGEDLHIPDGVVRECIADLPAEEL